MTAVDVTKTAKAGSPPWLRRLGTRALSGWAVLGYVYLFAPIVVIIIYSFNDLRGVTHPFNYTWKGFTLDNWAHPFKYTELAHAMLKSLQIAVLASTVATIMGTMIALAQSRYKFKASSFVDLILVLPLTTPEICLGSSLLTLFLTFGRPGLGFATILIAHIMFCVSFVALTVKARVRGFDWTLEDAAMDLGAPPFRTFTRVTLPLIMPGILAAFLLSFSLSIDDYIITVFNAGNTITFPIAVFNEQKIAVPPQIDVLASMILLVSVGLIALGTVSRLVRDSRAAATS
jgi:spermidine/putrescine transport system permease protein